jgi:hypothetical protein
MIKNNQTCFHDAKTGSIRAAFSLPDACVMAGTTGPNAAFISGFVSLELGEYALPVVARFWL